MTSLAIRGLIGVAPVLAFLYVLQYLDSFKLVRLRGILAAIAAGSTIATACYLLNGIPLNLADRNWARFGAPVFEEVLKAGFLYYLLRRNRIGFMVDGAIYGFAVGTGFALVETIIYLGSLTNAGLFVWVLRGLGTAVMHSGATAIVGTTAAAISDQKRRRDWTVFVPGLLIAFAVHIGFNSGLLPPAETAALTLVAIPPILQFVFVSNEKRLERWLTSEMDQELELIAMISSGEFANTHAGSYLSTMRRTFPPEIVGDMFCYVSMSLELTLRAKGDLLKKEAGFEAEADEDLIAKLQELDFLERSIGKAGMRALSPLLASNAQSLSQLRQLADRA
jgi:RsiW-degrading membrane proteinase PrsW (M82 family)